MTNSPELDGKYLGKITQDFAVVSDTLKEASYQLRIRQISAFPIFPISRVELPIGQLLIGKNEANLTWNYYISFLNEFIERGLVDKERLDLFLQAYKDPEEFCCLFVVDVEFTNFVFLPYPED
ncbi:MAG: hypothetical protein ACOVQA_00140 [Thermoflexibacteraceae bacterium]|jgi:hypothetical protein